VFTKKSATDVSYICCAKSLLAKADRIYPQFATHNAHSVAAVQALVADQSQYEFQCLHGMGESLYKHITTTSSSRCRIYAPVGEHRDLLAYLVRRLLENGANSSFVNQIVDEDVSPNEIAADPFSSWLDEVAQEQDNMAISPVLLPRNLYQPKRLNSIGWDLTSVDNIEKFNPYDPQDIVGSVSQANLADVEGAIVAAQDWSFVSASERSKVLNRAADLYQNISELREAVDFLRYYASQIEALEGRKARGVFVCISPWNFPLAIFTGQLSAALAAGNGVVVKPADSTPIVAYLAVKLLHKAGVPRSVLQFLPGGGQTVGSALCNDSRLQGICFTGSINTALTINRAQANNASPNAPLIAETGGLNAMIVDSTALLERAVSDVVVSAFQSAGQRCSALRMLYIQEDVADDFLTMLYGAMEQLTVGDPWQLDTDVGPLISADAQRDIQAYVEAAEQRNAVLKKISTPAQGHFVAPTVIKVNGIADLRKEIFGPVLHVATFNAGEINQIVNHINASDYGLTFGLHTRIDDRVEKITTGLQVGNIYINRNQIGAVVGSQPFGGEGLSGTGPKAGGPHYLKRFVSADRLQSQNRANTDERFSRCLMH